MIPPELARQISALRAEVDATTVPSGLLSWWGDTSFPDGGDASPPLSQPYWEGLFRKLILADVGQGVPQLESITGRLRDRRPDGVVPIAIADYALSRVKPDIVSRAMAAAKAGAGMQPPPGPLAECIDPGRAFMAAALLHDQWGQGVSQIRTRFVRFELDRTYYFKSVGARLPSRIEFDPGDGLGSRDIEFGEVLSCIYPDVTQATATVRCHFDGEVRTARTTIALGSMPAPPIPDETWSLRGATGRTGRANVFYAPGHTQLVNPLIVAEGFPGGYAYDYLYDVVSQHGMREALQTAGYDLVLVGFDQGLDLMQHSAEVMIACVERAVRSTSNPMVVGGVSMGGLVARYALTRMEYRGVNHNTRLFFTIDSPHRGAYTCWADQWFAHYFQNALPGAMSFVQLLDSPSNQQFVMKWLDEDKVVESPLRSAFMAAQEEMGGYPQKPRRIAVACGRGDGKRSIEPGAPIMEWVDSPFSVSSLRCVPEDGSAQIAEGEGYLSHDGTPPAFSVDSKYSWDGAPGGQNNYNALAAGMAQMLGCGSVKVINGQCCGVPTISALDIDMSPFEPVPSPGSGTSPFHDYICCEENRNHLSMTSHVAQWVVEKLGKP